MNNNEVHKYVQRAVAVEAICWDGTYAGAEVVVAWCAAHGADARHTHHWPDPCVCVKQGVAEVCVPVGEYLVYGYGRFYVRDPDSFIHAYEVI